MVRYNRDNPPPLRFSRISITLHSHVCVGQQQLLMRPAAPHTSQPGPSSSGAGPASQPLHDAVTYAATGFPPQPPPLLSVSRKQLPSMTGKDHVQCLCVCLCMWYFKLILGQSMFHLEAIHVLREVPTLNLGMEHHTLPPIYSDLLSPSHH